MSAGRQAFKLTEAARLIRAAVMAGLTVRGVTTNRDGRPVVITDPAEAASELSRDTSWDDLKDDAQDEKRPT